VEADRDETLKEIDNGVFGASLRMPVMISNQNDILGFGLYYLSRLYGREQIEDDISILHLKQILIYLVDDCERLLVHKKFLDVNIPFLNTAQLNSILYYLLEIHRLELFPVKVGKLFHYLPSHIEMLVDKNDDWADKQTLLQFIAKLMKLVSEAGLKNQFRKIARLISNMDLQNENDEAFINQITRLNWHKLVYTVDFTSNKNLGKLSEKAMAIVNDEENWNQRLDKLNKDNLGLNNGLAGLGLALLNEIRKCNNEEMKELKNEKIAV
jgi:hypothetical protein